VILGIRDLELRNRTVFLRLDFNVPLSAPNAEGERTIEEDARITEALPTIKYAIEQGAKLVLASHLGRPDGKCRRSSRSNPSRIASRCCSTKK